MMAGNWWQGPLTAFDLETTSADPETARIVTGCIASITPGQAPAAQNWLVDPGIDIPEEAAAIHGITTEKARAEGVDPAFAVEVIAAEIRQAWAAGTPVVIMNASYDLTVLDRELRRHCGQALGDPGPVIDPMVIDRELDKWRKGKRTLTDLCLHYQVKLDGAHTAAGDCLAAARVAWRIAQVYPQIGAMPLDELFAQQQAWREAWAINFADYRRAHGYGVDDIDGSWPIRRAA